ncbi:class A beta-lactamase [Elizabethkingia meningoseptica]
MTFIKTYFTSLLVVLGIININAQTTNNELKKRIENIITGKKADVGVSLIGGNKNDKVQINGNQLYPMLSTFKFPIALTVLHKVEKGELKMSQKIFIKKGELLDNTWSPFLEKYPQGNISITLEDALMWMMCYSDNNLTDILIRLIGGTDTVQKFIGTKDFIIKNDEEDMHKDWDSQFINKITPNRATQLLDKFYQGKILNGVNTKWLYEAMLNNKTGLKRLKGKLAADIKVAHRSGTSFTNDAGMTGAINSYGIIELPKNKKIVITVFVHDTYENFNDSEAIIADIAKTVYDYYIHK